MNYKGLFLSILCTALFAACSQSSDGNLIQETVNPARSQCVSDHGMWNESSNSCIESPKNQNDCVASDGRWIEATDTNASNKSLPPRISESYCELPAADAGKSCTDKSNCDKYCKPICQNNAEDCSLEEMQKDRGECAKFYNLSGGYAWDNGSIVDWRTY